MTAYLSSIVTIKWIKTLKKKKEEEEEGEEEKKDRQRPTLSASYVCEWSEMKKKENEKQKCKHREVKRLSSRFTGLGLFIYLFIFLRPMLVHYSCHEQCTKTYEQLKKKSE